MTTEIPQTNPPQPTLPPPPRPRVVQLPTQPGAAPAAATPLPAQPSEPEAVPVDEELPVVGTPLTVEDVVPVPPAAVATTPPVPTPPVRVVPTQPAPVARPVAQLPIPVPATPPAEAVPEIVEEEIDAPGASTDPIVEVDAPVEDAVDEVPAEVEEVPAIVQAPPQVAPPTRRPIPPLPAPRRPQVVQPAALASAVTPPNPAAVPPAPGAQDDPAVTEPILEKPQLPKELFDDDEDDFIGLKNLSKKSNAIAKVIREDPTVIKSLAGIPIEAEPFELPPVFEEMATFHEELSAKLTWLAETIIARDGLLILRVPSDDEIVEVQFKDLKSKDDIGMRFQRYPLSK